MPANKNENARLSQSAEAGPPAGKPWRRTLAVVMALGLLFCFLEWVYSNLWFVKYIDRARNSASQSMLQQLALAQTAHMIEFGRYADDWNTLADFGFHLDTLVRVKMVVLDIGLGESKIQAFLARANHVSGQDVYEYNSFSGSGVTVRPEVKPLDDEYAFHRPGSASSNNLRSAVDGPPITLIWARVPLPANKARNDLVNR